MKDTLIKIKNNFQGNNSRVYKAKNQINDLEHKEEMNNQSEKQEEKESKRDEDNKSSHWDNFKRSNICIIVIPERSRN